MFLPPRWSRSARRELRRDRSIVQLKFPRFRILPRSTAGWALLALGVGLTVTQIISILAFQLKLADVLRRIQFQNVAARVETIDKIVRALPEDARPQVLAL